MPAVVIINFSKMCSCSCSPLNFDCWVFIHSVNRKSYYFLLGCNHITFTHTHTRRLSLSHTSEPSWQYSNNEPPTMNHQLPKLSTETFSASKTERILYYFPILTVCVCADVSVWNRFQLGKNVTSYIVIIKLFHIMVNHWMWQMHLYHHTPAPHNHHYMRVSICAKQTHAPNNYIKSSNSFD